MRILMKHIKVWKRKVFYYKEREHMVMFMEAQTVNNTYS